MLFLLTEESDLKGFIKVLDMKKLYKNDGIGCLKQFNAPAIIDFFMLPENDLLDEKLGAKEFFEFVLS